MRSASSKRADIRDLLAQIRRHFGAIGLVIGESLLAECFSALEHGRDVLRLVLGPQLPQHVVENVNRFGGKSRGGAHGRRAAARAGMIGAENETVRVDQEQPRPRPRAGTRTAGCSGRGACLSHFFYCGVGAPVHASCSLTHILQNGPRCWFMVSMECLQPSCCHEGLRTSLLMGSNGYYWFQFSFHFVCREANGCMLV